MLLWGDVWYSSTYPRALTFERADTHKHMQPDARIHKNSSLYITYLYKILVYGT